MAGFQRSSSTQFVGDNNALPLVAVAAYLVFIFAVSGKSRGPWRRSSRCCRRRMVVGIAVTSAYLHSVDPSTCFVDPTNYKFGLTIYFCYFATSCCTAGTPIPLPFNKTATGVHIMRNPRNSKYLDSSFEGHISFFKNQNPGST